jgi:hypothetical protein
MRCREKGAYAHAARRRAGGGGFEHGRHGAEFCCVNCALVKQHSQGNGFEGAHHPGRVRPVAAALHYRSDLVGRFGGSISRNRETQGRNRTSRTWPATGLCTQHDRAVTQRVTSCAHFGFSLPVSEPRVPSCARVIVFTGRFLDSGDVQRGQPLIASGLTCLDAHFIRTCTIARMATVCELWSIPSVTRFGHVTHDECNSGASAIAYPITSVRSHSTVDTTLYALCILYAIMYWWQEKHCSACTLGMYNAAKCL